jgi:hypothetical protein
VPNVPAACGPSDGTAFGHLRIRGVGGNVPIMGRPRARRLHAYLTERLGIGTMPSSDWSAQQASNSGSFLIRESAMPFAGALGTILEPNRIATAASTSYNANCRKYVNERAFPEQQPRGIDHWQPSLPPSVSVLIAARTT